MKNTFFAIAWLGIATHLLAQPAGSPATTPVDATLTVFAAERSGHAIPAYITGKFAEHLGSNIYNGMSAQILRNPTFAEYPFWTGAMTPDGRTAFHSDQQRIGEEIRRLGRRMDIPDADIPRMIEGRSDGLAFWWLREGSRQGVVVSPDTGQYGGRAQRVEIKTAGEGIAQWVYLPLHRVRKYEIHLSIRSPQIDSVTVSLTARDAAAPAAKVSLSGVSAKWGWTRGTMELDQAAPADSLYRVSITASKSGQFVIDRALLLPADHIGGADPDIIRFLKESRLPILRWPGGNFASTYHWEDGIGPIEKRPTRPNYAWGGVEPNLFGTDEFLAFCRAVGCEPMICINGGDATPDEAARWIEYCNGPANSPMGSRRAANGHPQPYNVRHWEVGNELWGRWQLHWSTPAGYADRYRQFAAAMLKADPSIRLYACGAPVLWGREWNNALFAGAADLIRCTTDHPLIGGDVPLRTDPMDVYRDFMAVPTILERKWDELRKSMLAAGVKEPRLAVTELQLFAHLGGNEGGGPVRLTRENLVRPNTQAEALYDTLIYHTAIRLAPFVEMVTQSAVVNHGGGLSKERERTYAHPCHYAQAAFAAFAGATPVRVEVIGPSQDAPLVLPDIRGAGATTFPRISAVAALAADGAMLISIVDRGTEGAVRLRIALDSFKAAGQAEVWRLSAAVPWEANSLAAPQRIKPTEARLPLEGKGLLLDLRPFTVVCARIPATR